MKHNLKKMRKLPAKIQLREGEVKMDKRKIKFEANMGPDPPVVDSVTSDIERQIEEWWRIYTFISIARKS